MSKLLTIFGMIVAALVFILFTLDLAIGYPFMRAYLVIDIAFMVCALALGFISWSSFRELE